MNPLAFLAIAFGTAAVILFFVAATQRGEIQEWRQMNSELVNAGNDLVIHCDQLEMRNDFLESEYTRLNDLRAAGMMFVPCFLEMRGNEWVAAMGETRNAP
jgi:hypothetical protein